MGIDIDSIEYRKQEERRQIRYTLDKYDNDQKRNWDAYSFGY